MSEPSALAAPILRPVEYTYGRSIGASELRLLRPLQVTRSCLSFEVVRTARRSAPRYTAVSYTWGDGTPSQVIYLDGDAFRVRPNLWSCLYYLSRSKWHRGWSHLWVDAICINQNDDKERNAQVSKMDQTYRGAACVSVWLGLIPLPEHTRCQWPEYEPLLTAEVDNFCWAESITDLANRKYWSRFWVIQEFLLNNDVVLHCSDNMIDWLSFQDILCSEANFNQYGQAKDDLPTGLVDSFRALPLVTGRHPDKYPELLQPLRSLLIRHRKSICKDPRDRIFALLGLISLDEQGLLGRFFPDYRMKKEQVCIITLAHLTQCVLPGELSGTTAGFEELFLGLGIDSIAERKRLLSLAQEVDYLGASTTDELLFGIESNHRVENLTSGGYGAINPERRDIDPRFSERVALLENLISDQFPRREDPLLNHENLENTRGGTIYKCSIRCLRFVLATVALVYRYLRSIM